MSGGPKHDLDALVALAHAGAVQAAEAFAQLAGEAIEARPPLVVADATGVVDADPDATGVFFELDGCLDALIGIVLPGPASEALVRRIVGLESAPLEQERAPLEAPVVESALMEVGNILASHVASAIADRLGERLLPSIPTLAMAEADVAFEAFVARTVGADAPRIESPLVGAGAIRGRLVLVPMR